MKKKYGFLKLNIQEFKSWLKSQNVARTILYIQQHHTYNPDYDNFNGSNHFQLQQSMKNYHVNEKGWLDIGQHFTIFPDGAVLTGRNLENPSACIYGINSNSICIENLGNFDRNKDQMLESQKNSIIEISAELAYKFNVPVNTQKILYHHWFNLSTGERNNGTKNNKSCPGSNFFGGNKVSDAEKKFLPLIKSILNQKVQSPAANNILKYVCTTANKLNVREGAGINNTIAKDRRSIDQGTVIRVYQEKNGWYKISNSRDHWISKKYTTVVQKAIVKADVLNLRKGPGTNYAIVGKLIKDQEVFISISSGNWCKINNNEKWLSKKYLTIN